MRDLLPPADHAELVALMYEFAAGPVCICGRSKMAAARPFCVFCEELLLRAHCQRGVLALWHNVRTARQGSVLAFDWREYDRLSDVLLAIKGGRYTGKGKRQSLEDAEAWA